MTHIRFKTKPVALAVMGVFFIAFVGTPSCFAGGAFTIVKDEKQFAPRGSYIPERRVQKVLQKVEEHKAAMKAREKALQKEQSDLEKSPAPKSPDKQ